MTDADKRLPYMKWYPADWRADPRLRMCSLGARGLWIDLIGYMHEAEPYGHLVIAGVFPGVEDLAALVGRPTAEVRKALVELENKGVFSREDSGTIYSRRMVRDKEKRERDRENGRGGGNPRLKGQDNHSLYIEDKAGVNPPVKAQRPEARVHKPEKDAPLSPLAGGMAPAEKKAKRRLKGELPADWACPNDWIAEESAKFPGLDVRRQAERFKNYAHANGWQKVDWRATFRNWIDKEAQQAGIEPRELGADNASGAPGRDTKFDAEAVERGVIRKAKLARAGYGSDEIAGMGDLGAMPEPDFHAKLAELKDPDKAFLGFVGKHVQANPL